MHPHSGAHAEPKLADKRIRAAAIPPAVQMHSQRARTGALTVRSHNEQRVLASCWQPGRDGEMPLTMSTEQVGESVRGESKEAAAA